MVSSASALGKTTPLSDTEILELAAVSGTTVITVDIGASAAASSSISVSLSGVVFPKAEALETK